MITKKELRKISLQFRTLSSQMLKIDSEEEKRCLQSFYNFITETPVIFDYILSCHEKDYDFEAIFKNLGYHEQPIMPVDQHEMVDYGYQLMRYILQGDKKLFLYGQHFTSSTLFADMISALMRKGIEPFVVSLKSFLELLFLDAIDSELEEKTTDKTVFLSYCQKDADIADIIDNRLSEILGSNIQISRDIRDVEYHESFGQFMNTIPDHDFVILIISDHYLKSRNCLYEVMAAIKDVRYKERILFIVLSDDDKVFLKSPCEEPLVANVYTVDEQTNYTLFWKKKEDELQSQIEEIGENTFAMTQIKEKRMIQKILLDLPEFMEFIRDNKGLSLKEHVAENFYSMCKFMGFEQER